MQRREKKTKTFAVVSATPHLHTTISIYSSRRNGRAREHRAHRRRQRKTLQITKRRDMHFNVCDGLTSSHMRGWILERIQIQRVYRRFGMPKSRKCLRSLRVQHREARRMLCNLPRFFCGLLFFAFLFVCWRLQIHNRMSGANASLYSLDWSGRECQMYRMKCKLMLNVCKGVKPTTCLPTGVAKTEIRTKDVYFLKRRGGTQPHTMNGSVFCYIYLLSVCTAFVAQCQCWFWLLRIIRWHENGVPMKRVRDRDI